MLSLLNISNFALIDSVELHFNSGFNIITGETGAGKSIIVDALMMILGSRASSDIVRDAKKKTIIEGQFQTQHNPAIRQYLLDNNYDCDFDTVVIRREINANGFSRSFVNDSPAPYSVIKRLGELLVDFHGQHQHQSLFNVERHLFLLDNIGGAEVLRNEYQKLYSMLANSIQELTQLVKHESESRQKIDFQRFQLQEILSVAPKENEDAELELELSLIENSERLDILAREIYEEIYDNDNAVRDRLSAISEKLQQISDYSPEFQPYLKEIHQSIVTLDEISNFTTQYRDQLQIEPGRIEFIRQRLAVISRLKKKYGSVEQILSLQKNIETELEFENTFENEIVRREREIDSLRNALGKKGIELSEKRKKIAKEVEKKVVSALQTLGIVKAQFRVLLELSDNDDSTPLFALCEHKKYRAYPNGLDKGEFYISTNAGEDLRPLIKTASGGEISRVLLALKTILAASERLPMLVFDEIDTGISGRIAQKVGRAMKDLAAFHQIIAITHLPQVAAFADCHFSVEKDSRVNHTVISAKKLDELDRIREVAKLLSGENISEAALESARQLINDH